MRARGGIIRPADLRPAILASIRRPAGAGAGMRAGSAARMDGAVCLDEGASSDLRAIERSHRRERIEAALLECGGNRTRAASKLGLNRTTLIGIMKRLEIA